MTEFEKFVIIPTITTTTLIWNQGHKNFTSSNLFLHPVSSICSSKVLRNIGLVRSNNQFWTWCKLIIEFLSRLVRVPLYWRTFHPLRRFAAQLQFESQEYSTEGSPFTYRNQPLKTQNVDFQFIFACNTSWMQFHCNVRLSLAFNCEK